MINFEFETKEINTGLKQSHDYLSCEHIIVANIKKHIEAGVKMKDIDGYLLHLENYVEDITMKNIDNASGVNYKYAAGFLHTLNSTPYWHSWIKALDKTILKN